MLTANVEDKEQQEFNRAFRKILYTNKINFFSDTFLKRNSIAYIFNSRITQTNWHLIYRYNL
jgi:hypothetical protein